MPSAHRVIHFAAWAFALLLSAAAHADAPLSTFVNFEGAQVSPIRLSPTGNRLFAVNTPDARLSVFDLEDPTDPKLIAEIPVGIEPVSVNPRTRDEAWVVNQESDSISIVSVSEGIVTGTLHVKDEPADVVFALGKAFVSVSGSNEIRVFSTRTHRLIETIELFGERPRALAVNRQRTKVYTAFLLSGNGTTVVNHLDAPPPPEPTNSELPPAPQTSMIVDAKDPEWTSTLHLSLPDCDVAEIDVDTLTVENCISGVGTTNFAIAVHPTSGELYIANTEANNRIRFEPNLKGRFLDSRVTLVDQSGSTLPINLNPEGVSRANAISQPTDIEIAPSGDVMFVASFGTDRVAAVSPDGEVLNLMDLGPGTPDQVDPRSMRGPRGLALKWAQRRLYVLNRISNTISIIDADTEEVAHELPVGSYDPTPQVIREGRGFLYDAKLSGNGTGACAGCHIDVDLDLLAWDLGDPGGEIQTVQQGDETFTMHPMKGPMTTQSLRGLKDLEPFHWRGDRASFADFNGAFETLMGGEQLSEEDMTAFSDFIMTVRYMPNPHRNLDDSLPAELDGGDPIAGRFTYFNEPYSPLGNTCNDCHSAEPGPGSNREVMVLTTQPAKVPQLRNVYQRVGMSQSIVGAEPSISGFGLLHAGNSPSLFHLLSQPPFPLLRKDPTRKLNLAAYVKCFDTGTHPAVGYTQTVTRSDLANEEVMSDWDVLEHQAAAGEIDLIVKGSLLGGVHGLVYQPGSDDYMLDVDGFPRLTRGELRLFIAKGNVLTIMGTPAGSGVRMGVDRDLDGTLDGDES